MNERPYVLLVNLDTRVNLYDTNLYKYEIITVYDRK